MGSTGLTLPGFLLGIAVLSAPAMLLWPDPPRPVEWHRVPPPPWAVGTFWYGRTNLEIRADGIYTSALDDECMHGIESGTIEVRGGLVRGIPASFESPYAFVIDHDPATRALRLTLSEWEHRDELHRGSQCWQHSSFVTPTLEFPCTWQEAVERVLARERRVR